MNSIKHDLKLGITKEFPCNYLPNVDERLIIIVDEAFDKEQQYSWLMHQGFRRSGEQVYRPYCRQCSACQSIRVMVPKFKPSRSQKRQIKKCQKFSVRTSTVPADSYYALYEKYINTIHKDGAMYPASLEQYQNFLLAKVCSLLFIEIFDQDKLISVAVTDNLSNALSAVYTFYDPNYREYALGIFSILNQIDVAHNMGKEFLYLGYQIDDCQKMNYKNKFHPYQRLTDNQWFIVNK